MIRPPAVAGRFYPSDADELAQQVKQCLAREPLDGRSAIPALGCMVPHAGYIYSGRVAGAVYSRIAIPSRCILLGPRHFPRGGPLAILTEGTWQTPLGEVSIDSDLAGQLAHAFPSLREDALAHEAEHSLEVQLPFLQVLRPDIRIVPVVLATDRYPVLEELGLAVAQVVKAEKEKAQNDGVLVIASSDMNHYESDAVTREKDERAVRRVLALDPRGLFDEVRAHGITMCGYAATVAMLVAMRELGAENAELLAYGTSGDVNGDRERVVGYAGIAIQ